MNPQVVFLKLGGSLITDKARPETARLEERIALTINAKPHEFEVDPSTTLLDVLREQQLAQPPIGQQAPAAGPDY